MSKSKTAVARSDKHHLTPEAILSASVRKAASVYDLYGAWIMARGLVMVEIYSNRSDSTKDTAADRAQDDAVWGMIRTRARQVIEIRQKLEVYQELLEQGSGEWADQRDMLMLASIAGDLEAGEDGMKAHREMMEACKGGAK
jgi:hypothetical protein